MAVTLLDFSTGDLSQWRTLAKTHDDALVVLPAGEAPDGCPEPYACRVRVSPGEAPGESYGSRAELIEDPQGGITTHGEPTTVSFRLHFSDAFHSVMGHNSLLFGLHSTNISAKVGGGVNLELRTQTEQPDKLEVVLMGGRMELIPGDANWRTYARTLGLSTPEDQWWTWAVRSGQETSRFVIEHRAVHDLGYRQADRWIDFVVQITPAADETGRLDVWQDGAHVVGDTAPTVFSTDGVERQVALHVGDYRPSEPDSPMSELWVAGVRYWSA